MSVLLRALMTHKAEIEKINLAIIKEATTQIDSINGRLSIPCGISAKLEKGKKYHFIFDLEGEAVEVTNGSRNQILSKWPDNYLTPQNWGIYFFNNIATKFTHHYDIHATASKDADGNITDILQFDTNGMKGYTRIYNLEVYEE